MQAEGRSFALIIGNTSYEDPAFSQLVAPGGDVESLAGVLCREDVGDFTSVDVLTNEPADGIRRAIARFFADRVRQDLLVLYFSGHGVLDSRGRLYLVATDTRKDLLSGTAIPALFITEEMDHCASRRQILVLDCCHSGAFARGAKGAVGASVGTSTAFAGNGFGRIVLTASDATQYAWEGDEVHGHASRSTFTHYLVDGLASGTADLNQDGQVTVDELYDFIHSQIVENASGTRPQTPGKWTYRQQGDIVLARNPNPIAVTVALPDELVLAMESPLAYVREGSVAELERIATGIDRQMALAARAALERLSDDDSRRVSTAANQVLAGIGARPPEKPSEPVPFVADEVELAVSQGKGAVGAVDVIDEVETAPQDDEVIAWDDPAPDLEQPLETDTAHEPALATPMAILELARLPAIAGLVGGVLGGVVNFVLWWVMAMSHDFRTDALDNQLAWGMTAGVAGGLGYVALRGRRRMGPMARALAYGALNVAVIGGSVFIATQLTSERVFRLFQSMRPVDFGLAVHYLDFGRQYYLFLGAAIIIYGMATSLVTERLDRRLDTSRAPVVMAAGAVAIALAVVWVARGAGLSLIGIFWIFGLLALTVLALRAQRSPASV